MIIIIIIIKEKKKTCKDIISLGNEYIKEKEKNKKEKKQKEKESSIRDIIDSNWSSTSNGNKNGQNPVRRSSRIAKLKEKNNVDCIKRMMMKDKNKMNLVTNVDE